MTTTLAAGALTWSELNGKLQQLEQEKMMLEQEAATTSENMRLKLQQAKDVESRLRSEIRAFELQRQKQQHAALKTSSYYADIVLNPLTPTVAIWVQP